MTENGSDAADASFTDQVTDEAPMGADDLVDIAAAMQEQHVIADVEIRRRRRVTVRMSAWRRRDSTATDRPCVRKRG
jgi:hypothetical protein